MECNNLKTNNMEELNQKFDEIKALLEGNIAKMTKIVKEANDPEKRQEEARIFNEATAKVNSATNEIKSLVEAEKRFLDNFKPVVEHNQFNVDVKKPLFWILGAAGVMIVSVCVCIFFYQWKEKERVTKEKYKNIAADRYDNDMKYRYLTVYGNKETVEVIKDLNKRYSIGTNREYFTNQTEKREQAIEDAARAAKEAELRAQDAKAAKAKADSMNNSIK